MTTTPNIESIVVDNRPPHEIHHGQVRFAHRMADQQQNKLLHVTGLGWHHWDGARWALDDRGHAERAVMTDLERLWPHALGDKELAAEIRKCSTANAINGILQIASKLQPFAATADDLNADPYQLNVANGTLDLHTLELRPHNPADRITKVCRAAYDPNAPAPSWTKFLMQVLPDEAVRAYLQRVIGMALLGRVIEHLLPILTGTGRNGKGTFYKSVLWSLGDYGLVAEPDLFLARDYAHPTGQLDLMGRRLVVVSESAEGARFDEAKMKRLTGGDPITARKMRQDNITFDPSHQSLMITNHLPTVRGDDPATWARLRVIPFDVVIPDAKQDKHFDERLRAEADAILTWAINGWIEYQRTGTLNEPEAVMKRTSEYRQNMDAVARFIAEECLTAPALQATTKQLFEAWERWRSIDGASPISQKAFGLALDPAGLAGRADHERQAVASRDRGQTTGGQRWLVRPAVRIVRIY